jgi:hypothetical protein
VTRCHVCERPVDHDHGPCQPADHYDDDEWSVVMRNRIIVKACWSCWMKWPDDHKSFPALGFGLWPAEATSAYDLTLEQFLAYLRDAA